MLFGEMLRCATSLVILTTILILRLMVQKGNGGSLVFMDFLNDIDEDSRGTFFANLAKLV